MQRIFTESLGSPLSAYPLVTLPDLKAGASLKIMGHDLSKARYLCFAEFLAGTGRNDPGGFKDAHQRSSRGSSFIILAHASMMRI